MSYGHMDGRACTTELEACGSTVVCFSYLFFCCLTDDVCHATSLEGRFERSAINVDSRRKSRRQP